MFSHILGDSTDTEQREKVLKMYDDLYGNLMDMQHIEYRVISTAEKGLESFFTIKTSLSLLLFEMANAQKIDVSFIKCENCKNIFVPEGRCDAIYCSYPSPQNEQKSCKEVGAQIARANKEKTDIVTGAYRKMYMRYKMATQRHPHDKGKRLLFEKLTTGMKDGVKN